MPRHRPRVYIVGKLKSACTCDFIFTDLLPAVRLEPFLDPKIDISACTVGSANLAPMTTKKLLAMLAKIAKEGHDAKSESFVLDVDASPAFTSYMLGRCPYLLKARPRG